MARKIQDKLNLTDYQMLCLSFAKRFYHWSNSTMRIFFAFLATLFLAAPAWAVDVQMGYDGNLVFEPAEVTINAGDSVHLLIICFLLIM